MDSLIITTLSIALTAGILVASVSYSGDILKAGVTKHDPLQVQVIDENTNNNKLPTLDSDNASSCSYCDKE